MLFKFYEVGGKVRDELLGLKSKDVDYVAVPHETLLTQHKTAQEMFGVLTDYLKSENFEIFLITEDCYTIRAKFPKDHKYVGVSDFVMARREIGYIPGTRTPIVEPGTLYDDLSRRDFTLNALAKNEDGRIIDFFNGRKDLEDKVLRTPLDCNVTFDDDPLRILRCLRFSITKGFTIPEEMMYTIIRYDYVNKMSVVSGERIREELYKCLKHDTLSTLDMLNDFASLRNYIFTQVFADKAKFWLKPTFES
jgi:tRNA nucleotidyltransferase/poly(A) polymerase